MAANMSAAAVCAALRGDICVRRASSLNGLPCGEHGFDWCVTDW